MVIASASFILTFLMAASVVGQPVAVAEDVELKQGYSLPMTVEVTGDGTPRGVRGFGRDIRLTFTWEPASAELWFSGDNFVRGDGSHTFPLNSSGRHEEVLNAMTGVELKLTVSNYWGAQTVSFSLHVEDIGPATSETPLGWSPRLIDRGVYDEMVYDATNLEEGPNEHSWVLHNATPKVYVRMAGPGDDGSCSTGWRVDYDEIRLWKAVVPVVIEQLTGYPYRHPVEAGCEDIGERDGWITVTRTTPAEYRADGGGDWGGVGARARIGWSAGRIWMAWNAGSGSRWVDSLDEREFADLIAHELGHAMGFFHIGRHRRLSGRTAVMANPISRAGGWFFTPEEESIARAAYEAGRYAGRNTCPDGGWRCRAAEGPPRIVPRRPIIIAD